MYICKDCGTKYDIKPDYCDCGNDEFIYEENKIEKKSEMINKQNKNIWLKENGLSLSFFSVLIIIALIILFSSPQKEEKEHPVNNSKNINTQKAVNWDVFEDKETIKTPENIIEPQPIAKKETTKREIIKTETSKTTKIKKETELAKKKSFEEQKKLQEAQRKAKEEQRKALEIKKQAEQEALALKQKELNNYKNYLARLFYDKIDFSNIIGNGTCEISFKIDNSGNIINKSFSKQSSNTTLNDSVFFAVKNIYHASIPPSAYNSEILRLQVNFQNGSYSVSVN